MNLYQEHLMDHFKNPRHKGTLAQPTFSSKLHNPSCGDLIQIEGTVKKGVLQEAAFQGKGCVISQAAASILLEAIVHKPHDTISSLDKNYICSLLGISLGPLRIKCALLPLEALQQGLSAHHSESLP